MRLIKLLSRGESIRMLLWTFIKSFQVSSTADSGLLTGGAQEQKVTDKDRYISSSSSSSVVIYTQRLKTTVTGAGVSTKQIRLQLVPPKARVLRCRRRWGVKLGMDVFPNANPQKIT